MKKLSVLFAAVMMFVAVGITKAQKMATLDVATILNAMPEKKKADDQLMALSNAKRAELEKQNQSAQALLKKYTEEAPKQTQQVNDQRNAELQKLQENLQQMSQAAQKDMADKQAAAYEPIEKKINDAMTRVAKAQGYDFIFDAGTMGLLYKGGPDVTAAVKKELGL